MESQNQDDENLSWLESAVDERAVEIYQSSMLNVFHRMRIVDRLFLSERAMKGTAETYQDMKEFIYNSTNIENQNRLEEIKRTAPVEVRSINAAWYEPFDLSDEVIQDGIAWYIKINETMGEEKYMISLFMGQFIKKLYEQSTGARYSLTLPDNSSNQQFSDILVSFVSRKIYDPAEMVQGGSDQQSDDLKTERYQAASESERRFVQGIMSLSSEFNAIYSDQS